MSGVKSTFKISKKEIAEAMEAGKQRELDKARRAEEGAAAEAAAAEAKAAAKAARHEKARKREELKAKQCAEAQDWPCGICGFENATAADSAVGRAVAAYRAAELSRKRFEAAVAEDFTPCARCGRPRGLLYTYRVYKSALDGDWGAVHSALLRSVALADAENDADGVTALAAAAGGGHAEVVALLLRYNAKLDTPDDAGRTALSAAVGGGHLGCALALLEAGADPAAADHHGRTPLWWACRGGQMGCLEALLGERNQFGELDADAAAAVVRADADGVTALMCAAGGGHTAATRALVAAGADVNAADTAPGSGRTALLHAAGGGHVAAVQELARAGANLDAADVRGRTALDTARRAGHQPAADAIAVCQSEEWKDIV